MNNIDKNKKESENKHSLLDQKGINIVTVAIAVTCAESKVSLPIYHVGISFESAHMAVHV